MKSIKVLAFLLMIVGKTAFANGQLEGTYSFQLYFGNSEPFTDELTLKVDENGKYSGSMHVPNDFDAELEGIQVKDSALGVKELLFSISLPGKYHEAFGKKLFYKIQFLHKSPATIGYQEQFVGFVTHHKSDYRPTYVGSIVGFRKKN